MHKSISDITKILPALFLCCYFFISCKENKIQTLSANNFETIITQLQQKSGNTPQTLHSIETIYRKYPNASIDFKFKYLSYACGYYHIYKQDEDSANIYADSMISLVNKRADKNEFINEEAIADMSKGDVLFAQKKYPEAYQYYYLGKVAAEKSLDACTYSEYAYRLAMVLYKQSSYLEAANYFKITFNKSEDCKNDFSYFIRRQEVLNNAGFSFFKAKVFDSAKLYYEKTLVFLEEHQPRFPQSKTFFEIARGVVYGNLAQVYATSDFNKAEQLYKESISINSKPLHDINDAVITQSHLANLYFDKQEFDKGFAVLSAIKTGLDTIKNADIETEWNRLMWKYYDHEKQLNEAYTYLNKYENLKAKNTTANENFKGSITDVFDNLQSQYEISLLTKNDKVNSLYLILLLGGLVLFSIIILLVWYNWRKSLKYVKVLQEYTQQIRNQKQALEKTIEIVENQNKEKDSILRVVAHDLRNPINGIVSLLSIIKETPELNEHGELLKIMETACFDALNMITGILKASEALSGTQKISPLSITQIVDHTVQLLHYKAEEKDQHISIFSPKNDQVVLGNEEQLRRVLSNLITNAVKFSPASSDINIKIIEHNNSVEIMVEDKGIGIPPYLKDKVFNVFTEAKRYGTQNEKPFGLGLSICKQIIENHKGEIWFTTEEGKGTTFHVMLPKK